MSFIHKISFHNFSFCSINKQTNKQTVSYICISLLLNIFREHILHRVLVPMSSTKATQEMYEEESFLRKRNLLTFLRQILEPLDEFHIVLENSITQGIPSHC